jgi:prepilin-type N-terminal cleavage/methylation domain-containing protein
MQVVRNAEHRALWGFSLIELVIVVVIIGIIGAIAVPRMSRGAKGASDSAVTANLTVLRNAIDLYATEHGGDFPTLSDLPAALLTYTDGTDDATPGASSSTNIYGPYIRTIPKLPVGANKGLATFTATVPGGSAASAGWYYNTATGEVKANCKDTEVDVAAVQYNAY